MTSTKEEYQLFEEKFLKYIRSEHITAEQLSFSTSCHSVEDAVRTIGASAGASANDFIKNICLVDNLNRLIIAIVLGDENVSRKKLARALQISMPEFASKELVEKNTGYPIGGIPPFGYEALFVIDEAVMGKAMVYTSGGSPYSLAKIAPAEMLRANQGLVAKIGKR